MQTIVNNSHDAELIHVDYTNSSTCAVGGANQLQYMQRWLSTELIESRISSVDRHNTIVAHHLSVLFCRTRQFSADSHFTQYQLRR